MENPNVWLHKEKGHELIERHGDRTFQGTVGCLTCNLWLTPVLFIEKTSWDKMYNIKALIRYRPNEYGLNP